MNFLYLIANSLLWFHRLIGVTFSGCSMNHNYKFEQVKFFKYYGYIFMILVLSVCYVFHYVYCFIHPEHMRNYDLMIKLPAHITFMYALSVMMIAIRRILILHTLSMRLNYKIMSTI